MTKILTSSVSKVHTYIYLKKQALKKNVRWGLSFAKTHLKATISLLPLQAGDFKNITDTHWVKRTAQNYQNDLIWQKICLHAEGTIFQIVHIHLHIKSSWKGDVCSVNNISARSVFNKPSHLTMYFKQNWSIHSNQNQILGNMSWKITKIQFFPLKIWCVYDINHS